MAPEIPLYKDEKYVELLGETLRKLKEGFENNVTRTRRSGKPGSTAVKTIEFTSELYNRAVNALLSQPDRAFLEVMAKGKNLGKKLDIVKFAEEITNAEGGLLRKFQPVLGMEAHHILPQNVMTWLSELSPKKALQALHLYRKGGGTTGVTPQNIKVGSQLVHRAASSVRKLADRSGVANFVSAHVDPLSDTLVDNTKLFMEGFDRRVKGGFKTAQRFTEKDSLKFIVETIKDQAGLPSKFFAKAMDQDIEVKAKDWIKHLTGREDLFKLAESGTDPGLIKKYNKALSALGINFNDIVKAVARGDELPGVSEDILNVFKNFNESAASKVDKTWTQNQLITKLKANMPDTILSNPFVGKTLKGKGTRVAIGGAIPLIGLPIDAAHAGGSIKKAYQEPTTDNILRAGSSVVNLFEQTGLFDAYVHWMTNPNMDPNKGVVNLVKLATEGAKLTSTPGVDKDLGAHLAGEEMNMTSPHTVEIEEEDEETGETVTKQYPGLRLPLS